MVLVQTRYDGTYYSTRQNDSVLASYCAEFSVSCDEILYSDWTCWSDEFELIYFLAE